MTATSSRQPSRCGIDRADTTTTRDQTLLSQDELRTVEVPLRRSFALIVASALALPWAWGFFGLLAIAWAIYVGAMRARRSYRSFGRPQTLGTEAIATLVAIPVSGLVASVGTSLAFYRLSRAGSEGWDDGWDVLTNTVAISLSIIFGFVWLLARHQSGTAPLPFERDVDPQAGIQTLRKLRTDRTGSFLPGQAVFAAKRANEALLDGDDARPPKFRDAALCILRRRADQLRLLTLAVGGMLWVLFALIIGGRWWAALALCCGSICTVVIAGGFGGVAGYFDQLRWAKRELALRTDLARRQAVEDEVSTAELVRLLDAIDRQLSVLRRMLEDHQGHSPMRRKLQEMVARLPRVTRGPADTDE
jgi:hypothetical protein